MNFRYGKSILAEIDQEYVVFLPKRIATASGADVEQFKNMVTVAEENELDQHYHNQLKLSVRKKLIIIIMNIMLNK